MRDTRRPSYTPAHTDCCSNRLRRSIPVHRRREDIPVARRRGRPTAQHTPRPRLLVHNPCPVGTADTRPSPLRKPRHNRLSTHFYSFGGRRRTPSSVGPGSHSDGTYPILRTRNHHRTVHSKSRGHRSASSGYTPACPRRSRHCWHRRHSLHRCNAVPLDHNPHRLRIRRSLRH